MASQETNLENNRESQVLLIRFLQTTDLLLERVLVQLVIRSKVALSGSRELLTLIWHDAQRYLRSVTESIRIGLNRKVRKALETVGMFGDVLKAKFELLTFDIREGAVRRVLKRVNSMLSSLAKVFAALHVVKEFKDHVEATIDGLRDSPEIIDLKDLLEPK